ncbi:thermonuclease family protein [Pseudonocardia sp. KRD291]|uniref:thermonuclease family protein n=1 Tax=Pseudonocardia sp. KRD291 TaxID=2792007 RepID=UPI001C49F404|nr:thermonuclease family protein [Pseudonocardia sp. KRD291]MBW0102756.1 thermonuclease family protein [Pseudonocardia sp. KRD291]
MAKGTLFGGVIVIGILFAACSPGDGDEATPGAAPAPPAASYSPAPEPSAVPVVTTPPFTGEAVTVTEVVDGDTFRTGDGREIRVLGIDSCEKGTYGGGLAVADAEQTLTTGYGGPVTLTVQAGVDTDRNGRHLRYVQFGDDHEDFGEYMVANDHTGVYQGRHDASPDYVARLYALDTKYSTNPPSGRECGDPTPAPVTGDTGPSYSYDGDDDVNMPDGALTGGYCARKWWC